MARDNVIKIAIWIALSYIFITFVHGGKMNSPHVTINNVTDASDGLTEGPHWDHRTQKLYFVDMYNQYIRRLDPATGVVTSAYIGHDSVTVVVPVNGTIDQLAVGSGRDLILVRWDGNSDESRTPFQVLCSVDIGRNETRLNDGKVDSSGRFWLGTMDDNKITGVVRPDHGTLYRIDDKLEPKPEISPVSISNGLAWNIEDNTFYYIDSSTRQIAAYDYDPNNGTIANKKIVFDLNETDFQGIPDGMTIDTNGNLWAALSHGHYVLNVNPKTGKVLRDIKLPAEDVTSVAFGGPLLDILYVTTSGRNLTEEQRKATPQAGSVFAVKGLGVRGIPANSFMMNELKQTMDN